MAKNDDIKLWFISLSPDIINNQTLIALKKAGKGYLISALYDIIWYAARQPERGFIEYISEYSSIEDQLAEILHYPKSQIIDTLKTFEPMGWIVPIPKQDSLLLDKLSVPVYPAFTYDKSVGAIRKAVERFNSGKPTKGFIPTINQVLSGTSLPEPGTYVPKVTARDICPQYKSKRIELDSSCCLLSTQGNLLTTNLDSTNIVISKTNLEILKEFDITEKEVLKATLEAESSQIAGVTIENRNNRINQNILTATIQIKDGNVRRPRSLLINAIRFNYH